MNGVELAIYIDTNEFDKELDSIVFSKPTVDEDICNKVFEYLKK